MVQWREAFMISLENRVLSAEGADEVYLHNFTWDLLRQKQNMTNIRNLWGAAHLPALPTASAAPVAPQATAAPPNLAPLPPVPAPIQSPPLNPLAQILITQTDVLNEILAGLDGLDDM